jgi:regulatory protein
MTRKDKAYTVQEIKVKMEYYCAYQDRCHYDVEKKLKEFFLIPEARDEILLSLMSDKFLNEERFAKSYVRGKFRMKSWGRRKIVQELKKRNISEYLINIGLKEIDQDEYYSTIEKLLLKKKDTIKTEKSYELRNKLISFMMNKGFEYEEISDVLEDVTIK